MSSMSVSLFSLTYAICCQNRPCINTTISVSVAFLVIVLNILWFKLRQVSLVFVLRECRGSTEKVQAGN